MKRSFLISYFLLLAVFTQAQAMSPWGKSFWASFMPIPTTGTTKITLHITTSTATDITITNPNTSFIIEKTVIGATTTQIVIPVSEATAQAAGIQNSIIHITANKPIRVLAVHESTELGVEATPVLPESFSGRKYYIMSASGSGIGKSTALIIASQNNTVVNITPSVNVDIGTGIINKGATSNVTLKKGQTLMLSATNNTDDITGTLLEVGQPGKKIMVYAGVTRAKIPDSCGNQSNVIEQLLPVEMWDTQYVANNTGAGASDLLKILASEDQTTVWVDGVNTGTYNKGDFNLISFDKPKVIRSNKPIFTALISKGKGCVTGDGAPSLTCLTPWALRASKTLFSTPQISASYIDNNVVSIIVPTQGIYSTKFDNYPIFPNQFTPLPGDTSLSQVLINVGQGEHVIDAFYGATVYSFGYGTTDAYGALTMGEFNFYNKPISAQETSRFWSSFHWDYENNPSIENVEVTYIVSSPEDCNVRIASPSTGWRDVFSIKANTPTEVSVPAYLVISDREGKNGAAINIMTDKKSRVYAMIRDKTTIGTAVTNLVPQSDFSQEYLYTASDTGATNITIVSASNGAIIEIQPRYNTAPQAPVQIELDYGEAYSFYDDTYNADLSGTSIRSVNGCHKFAVFSGSATDYPGCNAKYTIQQANTNLKLGKKYIIPFVEPLDNVNLRFTTHYDVTSGITSVGNDSTFSYNIKHQPVSQYFKNQNLSSNGYAYFESDKPIELNINPTDTGCGTQKNYPFLSQIYNLDYLMNYACFKLFSYTDSGYVNIVAKTSGISSFKINGQLVNSSLFNLVAEDTAYSYIKLKLPAGNYYITSDSGFNGFVYGGDATDGYGYSLGYDYHKRLNYTVSVKGQTVANVPDLPSGTFDAEDNLIKICGSSGKVIIESDFTPAGWWLKRDNNLQSIPGHLKEFSANFNDTGLHTIEISPQCASPADKFSAKLRTYGFPEVDAGNDTTVCPFDTVQLQATGGVKFWWWNNRSVSDSSLSNPYTIAKFDNILGVFITDTNNCTNFDLVAINIVDSSHVIPNFYDTVICEGESVTLSARGGEGDPSKYTFYWDNGLGQGATHNVSPDSTTTYMVIGIYPCGNLEPDTEFVKVRVRPKLELLLATNDTAICEGDTVKFKAVPSGGLISGYTYDWRFSGNKSDSQIYMPTKTTTYWAILNDGCSATPDTAYQEISVIEKSEKLDVEIIGDTLLCKGEKGYVKAVGSGGRPSSYTYEWNLGLPSLQEHTINTNSPLTLTVKLKDGCTSDSAFDKVTIRFRDPIEINQPDDITLCSGDEKEVKVTAKGSISDFYKFTWSHGLGEGNTKTIKATQSKTITVRLKDDCGDSVETTFDLKVQLNPIANFDVSDTAICQGQSVVFTDLSVIHENNTRFIWHFGDGDSSNATRPRHTYKEFGVFDVTLTLLSPLGCRDTIVKPAFVETLPTPIAGFYTTPDTTDIRTPFFQFYNTSTIDGTFFKWDLGDGTKVNDENPEHTYSDTGKYYITQIVENDIGCADTSTSFVFIKDYHAIFIPNAFTPNYNNLNEVFKPEVRGVRKYTFMVYSRWGEQLFKTDNINEGWDGTYRGNPVEQGAYVYIVYLTEYNREPQIYKGTFILLR